jgi:hypothetical protein
LAVIAHDGANALTMRRLNASWEFMLHDRVPR